MSDSPEAKASITGEKRPPNAQPESLLPLPLPSTPPDPAIEPLAAAPTVTKIKINLRKNKDIVSHGSKGSDENVSDGEMTRIYYKVTNDG
jgi:hypothetical protein